jgi:hypothetical protein
MREVSPKADLAEGEPAACLLDLLRKIRHRRARLDSAGCKSSFDLQGDKRYARRDEQGQFTGKPSA